MFGRADSDKSGALVGDDRRAGARTAFTKVADAAIRARQAAGGFVLQLPGLWRARLSRLASTPACPCARHWQV